MKMRNKGKVHPSPSSFSLPSNKNVLSVFNLLPVAILALVSVLSVQDKEVLAYMITRSIKSTNPSSIIEEKKKKSKKSNTHKPPVFDCECFDCYISYWFKWDSSPNRELIHQAIEAFDEHMNKGETSRKNRNKKREKMDRRGREKVPVPERDNRSPEIVNSCVQVVAVNDVPLPEKDEVDSPEEVAPPEMTVNNQKGMGRKTLSDLLGLFNSRLWSFWGPKNV